jgi:hypothetical protein
LGEVDIEEDDDEVAECPSWNPCDRRGGSVGRAWGVMYRGNEGSGGGGTVTEGGVGGGDDEVTISVTEGDGSDMGEGMPPRSP